ncbi:MAG: porin family protein [Planctomycetota bacterium]|jgi:opacity protein-like surface antigen
MNIKTAKLSSIAIISLLVFSMTASICSAQEWSRQGKHELFGVIQQIGSEEVRYTFPAMLSVTLDIDEELIYGVGYGYNLTDHWNFNADLLFGSADTDIKVGNTKADTVDMDYILIDINFDYNFWKSRFTPLVTGGIGIMDFSIDTDAVGVGSVDESNVSFNLGAGVRWDVSDKFFLKAIYRSIWTELDDSGDDLQYDNFSLSVAYMF